VGAGEVLVGCPKELAGYRQRIKAEAVLVARPTLSRRTYHLAVDQVLRAPGGRECLVIDFADDAGGWGLVTFDRLLGEGPGSGVAGSPFLLPRPLALAGCRVDRTCDVAATRAQVSYLAGAGYPEARGLGKREATYLLTAYERRRAESPATLRQRRLPESLGAWQEGLTLGQASALISGFEPTTDE
jgi:hypothetical protein